MKRIILIILIAIIPFSVNAYTLEELQTMGYNDCNVYTRNMVKYAGYYKNGKITIDLEACVANTEHVYLHEYGHYIWEEKLTPEQRAFYRKGYTKGKGYFSTLQESWAEDYAQFEMTMLWLKPDNMKRTEYDGKLMMDILTVPLKAHIRSW